MLHDLLCGDIVVQKDPCEGGLRGVYIDHGTIPCLKFLYDPVLDREKVQPCLRLDFNCYPLEGLI